MNGALTRAVDGGSWAHFFWYAILFGAGAAAGLMSLVYYDGWLKAKRDQAMLGPGAASTAEFEATWVASLSASAWLSLLIATGIGLHNATEGFGIVAPMSGEASRPSWRFLALLGLIGGGPTFVGTLIGQAWASEGLSILFLALAAGSILYVVLQLVDVNRRLASKTWITWFVLAGLFLGFATEFVVEAAGV